MHINALYCTRCNADNQYKTGKEVSTGLPWKLARHDGHGMFPAVAAVESIGDQYHWTTYIILALIPSLSW